LRKFVIDGQVYMAFVLAVVGLMLLPGLAVTAFGLTSLPSALGEGFGPIRRVGVACRVSLGVMQWRAPPPNRAKACCHRGCPPPSTAAGCWCV
jgi:hypothetical protein